jgi:hypothetical protein
MNGSPGSNDERFPQEPAFGSLEEEAAFWDTHDFTDSLDKRRPASARYVPNPNLSAGMTVRLDPADREALGCIAAERGIGPSTLVRMWIKERLRDESEVGSRESEDVSHEPTARSQQPIASSPR